MSDDKIISLTGGQMRRVEFIQLGSLADPAVEAQLAPPIFRPLTVIRISYRTPYQPDLPLEDTYLVPLEDLAQLFGQITHFHDRELTNMPERRLVFSETARAAYLAAEEQSQ